MDNGIIYIDKVGLEDGRMVEYHKADFGIIGGYSYNGGRTNTINRVMEELCDFRKKFKQ